jgi:hypothetical protein
MGKRVQFKWGQGRTTLMFCTTYTHYSTYKDRGWWQENIKRMAPREYQHP